MKKDRKDAALRFTAAIDELFPETEFSARQTPRAMLSRPLLLDIDHHTLTRYMDGRLEIPMKIWWAVYGLQMCKRHDKARWRRITE